MPAQVIALIEHKKRARLLTEGLTKLGYKTIIVERYDLAKAILLDKPCRLIISDVHLENGGSVFDFLRWVRENPQPLGSIPFVLLSVEPTKRAKYLQDGVIMAARHLGANRCISMEKFDIGVLADHLAEILIKQNIDSDESDKKSGE